MATNDGLDDVNPALARAVGLFALSDASIHEAASAAGITRWELEDAIESAGLAEEFGIDEDVDVKSEIDDLLDR